MIGTESLTSDKPSGWDLTNQTFDFVTGAWFAKQVRKSSAGTAVDQWTPVRFDFRSAVMMHCDPDLIKLIAECWGSPLASGYLPRTYDELRKT
jgi:hypothetical protein